MDNEIQMLAALQNKAKGGHLKLYTKFDIGTNGEYIVCGEVHGDPRWADGMLIHTSLVIHHYEDEKILETRNTYYTLGEEITEDDKIERSRLLSAL